MNKILKESVSEEIFNRMELNHSEMLKQWNEECKDYYSMSDEEVGECGENLSRFQAAVFGEGIEEYLDEMEM